MPTLVVKYKDGSSSFPLREGVPVFIGRAKECDIHLPSPAVSRRHAVIIFKNGICGVKDLGSFNGTLVNGRAIDGAEHLTDADAVSISSFIIRLDASDIMRPQTPATMLKKGTTVILPESGVREGLEAAGASGTSGDGTDDAMDTPAPPAPAGIPRPDSRTFPNSGILLPRAMSPAGDEVEEMLENLRKSGTLAAAGPDTAAYVPASDAPAAAVPGPVNRPAFSHIAGGNPESTVEVVFPTDYARSLAREAQDDLEAIMPPPGAPAPDTSASGRLRESCNWFDTDYFRDGEDGDADAAEGEGESPEEEPTRDNAAPAASPAEEPSEAEKIIPLHEPERAPRLTLEWDDNETNRALEALVADVSEDVTERRSNRAAAASARPAEPDADAAGALPADAVYSGEAPAETEAVDEDYTKIYRNDSDGATAYDTVSAGIPYDPGSAKTAVPGVEPIVITPSFMAAVNARLSLYPLLLDLAESRRAFREETPNLSPGVAAELDRQDAELDALPSAEEAERMLAALAGRRAVIDAAAAQARAGGLPLPDAGNESLRRAEEMAESQWRLVRDSNRETLPAVYKEAYHLASDEPLARDFAAARINHGRLFGGAVYLLALEVLAETARAEREDIAEQLRRLNDKGLEKDAGGILGRLGKLGGAVNKVRNRTEIRELSQQLEERDREHAAAAGHALRESAFIEKALNREFRQVFMQAAAHFGAADDMPPAVRAFLRYGVIGFKPWWMRREIREFIQSDCRDNIVQSIEAGPGSTIVLYADECLSAVADMECPPFPDESIAGHDRDSVEWRTERAFRRIVNAGSYNILMDDMLSRLDAKLQEFEDKSVDIERRIAELRDWSSADNSDELFRLQTEQQVIAIHHDNMEKHIKRIETEVVASILEAVEDAERRFRRDELRMPDAAALAAKEGESLAVMARRIGGAQQRFMPLVLRELASPAGINDRKSVAARLAGVEKCDPGVFVSTIIPAKKKENRVELRLSPVVVIFPCAGMRGVFATPRDGMEGGHLVVPMCFLKKDIAEAVYAGLLADFRWETSRLLGGQDVENSDTLAGAFMRFRREWHDEPQQRREKGFIFNELTDKRNWRRVYAAYLSDAANSTRRLPARNPDLYADVIEPYIG